ncbi:MAG: IS4 family transposase [Acidipropionibacterium sp.]|jgi:hypothetical protein|nr:IS4 family transposase [Acidipropionibacterium sp.]
MPNHATLSARHEPDGVFAPAHLGELTTTVPPEMIDAILDQTATTQHRVRRLPSRLVVYLILAGALYAGQAWTAVWNRLTAGLPHPIRHPAKSSISQAMRRLGPAPLEALFRLLAGPGACLPTQQIRCAGRLVAAIDGTQIAIPDTPANGDLYPRQKAGRASHVGYPMIRMLALVAVGTRHLIDAVWGPDTISEKAYTTRLAAAMGPGMLVLGDRGFATIGLYTAITTAGADFLIRGLTGPRALTLPVLERLGDGSWISRAGTVRVRVIDAEIEVTPTDRAGRPIPGEATIHRYRLITSLLDPAQAGAGELIRLYHRRWQIETVYCELKSTILGGRVLRGRYPAAVAQEVWGLLAAYQVLRIAMSDAILDRPEVSADRLSFTIAVRTAQDQIVLACRAISGARVDLVGRIGAAVLDDLLPRRGPRTRPRALKRGTSKYHAAGGVDLRTRPARLRATVLTPATDP